MKHAFLRGLMTTLGCSLLGTMLHAQAAPAAYQDKLGSASQVSLVYQRTLEDYQVVELNGTEARVELNGAAGEYAWRRFFPIEIVGRVSYAKGQPLGQSLITATGGVGYARHFFRYSPFVRFTAGLARTSSSDLQYGSTGSTGFCTNLDGGIDVRLTHRWGVRAIELQNQYLPFGMNHLGSVYWSLGAGVTYRLGH